MVRADTSKVGINKVEPTEFLDVGGSVNVSGSYKINEIAIKDTTHNDGTSITINGSNNINLNSTISLTGNVTANGFNGPIQV